MCRNSIGIIDYDSCWSLQNKKVRSDLSILFQETNLPSDVIIMANVLIKNRGYKAEDWKTTDLQLGEIPGFDGWEVVWFNDYISKKEGKPGCPPVYRTLLMCKKQGFSGTPVSFYFVRRRKRNK